MPFRGSVGALPLFLFWYCHYITLLLKSQGEFVNNSSGFSGALTALFRGVSRVTGCACVWFVALVVAIEPPFFIVFAIDRARSIYRSGIVNRLRCFYKYRADGLTPAAARGSARLVHSRFVCGLLLVAGANCTDSAQSPCFVRSYWRADCRARNRLLRSG